MKYIEYHNFCDQKTSDLLEYEIFTVSLNLINPENSTLKHSQKSNFSNKLLEMIPFTSQTP